MNRRNQSFWQRIGKELQDFFIWFVKRIISWIKSFIRWVENIGSVLAEESQLYAVLVLISGLGVAIYLFHDYLPLSQVKREELASIASFVSFGSAAFVALRVMEILLNKVGLLEAVKYARDKILTILGLKK